MGSVGMPDISIDVDGTPLDWVASFVQIDRIIVFSRHQAPSLTFSVANADVQTLPDPYAGKLIEVSADEGSGDVLIFAGYVEDGPAWRYDLKRGWVQSYTARGLRSWADRVPVTNPVDGSDSIAFNLPFEDRDYRAAMAGRTVGYMLQYALDAAENAADLTAHGITGYNSGDLTALDLIPPAPVYIQGERLLTALEGVLRQWAPNHALTVDPDGTIRVKDVTAFTPTTLTIGTDPVDLASLELRRGIGDCFTRVRVRGGPNVIAVSVGTKPAPGSSEADNGLAEDFGYGSVSNSDAKDLWSLYDFTQPGDIPGRARANVVLASDAVDDLTIMRPGYGYANSTAYTLTFSGGGGTGAAGTITSNSDGTIDGTSTVSISNGGSGYTTAPYVTIPAPEGAGVYSEGSCSCTSTTEVEIDPTSAKETWAANYWDQTSSGVKGQLFLDYDLGTSGGDLDSKISVLVTANDALTAGGTATFTVDPPLPHLDFNSYQLYGTAGGPANVWRKYAVTNAAYAGKLLQRFPRPVPFRTSDGGSVTLTSRPTATVLFSQTGEPPYFESPIGADIDPDTGTVLLHVPSVTKFGTTSNLLQGGSATDGIPADVRVLLAVADGAHEAIYPADSGGSPVYSGTAYSVEGIEETLTVTIPSWTEPRDQSRMDDYAEELHKAYSDSVIEGEIPLLTYASGWLAYGKSVDLEASGWASPWDGIVLPVVEAEVQFPVEGSTWVTLLRVSTRRQPLTDNAYTRPPQEGLFLGGLGFGGGETIFAPAQFAAYNPGGIGQSLTFDVSANPWVNKAHAMGQQLLGAAQAGGQNWIDTANTAGNNWLNNARAGANNWLSGNFGPPGHSRGGVKTPKETAGPNANPIRRTPLDKVGSQEPTQADIDLDKWLKGYM